MGSPGDLMRSTMAGEMRNSKFSTALRSAAMSPTSIPEQPIAFERADELVVVVARQRFIEQLDRGRDLFLAEQAGLARQLLKPCALREPERAQRATHGPPSRPGPRARRARRCA